ncbi:hypothetical protein [Burkholderia sp. HI2714]|uniref:hypothetical protein n=1 Tax=Burkholderia sp. HI2714 TaxID=2015359 RepID=UPI00117D4691|nr:hypothetical protein [Burkholderia sp. HI2714]
MHDTECATGHINANYGTPDPDTVYSSHLNNPIRLDFLATYGSRKSGNQEIRKSGNQEIRKLSINQINTGPESLVSLPAAKRAQVAGHPVFPGSKIGRRTSFDRRSIQFYCFKRIIEFPTWNPTTLNQ